MDRLITVKDICNRYSCSLPTARKYIRQMFHYENPLTVPVWAFAEWERSRERMPADKSRKTQIRKNRGTVIVPRKR